MSQKSWVLLITLLAVSNAETVLINSNGIILPKCDIARHHLCLLVSFILKLSMSCAFNPRLQRNLKLSLEPRVESAWLPSSLQEKKTMCKLKILLLRSIQPTISLVYSLSSLKLLKLLLRLLYGFAVSDMNVVLKL